ncbi:hypothetical protein PIROE2DRAFT_10229 [Piromyces sp. E2]|nr:hypothetical protein PIROE2DRAFT_10229 [Piromyces sp. E2]|eukprot:OUM63263.1 hypothetical protein PIROE2DRAFT_10229 [Piromyces sp. E2]
MDIFQYIKEDCVEDSGETTIRGNIIFEFEQQIIGIFQLNKNEHGIYNKLEIYNNLSMKVLTLTKEMFIYRGNKLIYITEGSNIIAEFINKEKELLLKLSNNNNNIAYMLQKTYQQEIMSFVENELRKISPLNQSELNKLIDDLQNKIYR